MSRNPAVKKRRRTTFLLIVGFALLLYLLFGTGLWAEVGRRFDQFWLGAD